MLDDLDRKIIAVMQGEFPLVPQPYQELAQRVGISEDELLRKLNSYQRAGHLRKMGTVLRHREVGYAANALCAWIVESERLDEVAAVMTKETAITHCYSRISIPNWPYNFYTMIHAHTKKECQETAKRLSALAKVDKYVMLYSTREWKKSSMQYFSERRKKQ